MPPAIPRNLKDSFTSVDNYICDSLVPQDEGLISALKANAAADLDEIDVAPNQGKLLHLLAKMNNVKRYLEVGTLGGYSAIWVAKALPADGKIITLEIDPMHATVATSNFATAGFSKTIEVKVGPALESLAKMDEEGVEEPFDMVFIDADKQNNLGYFRYALKFARKGTLIIVDNVVRQGRVADWENLDPAVTGVTILAFLSMPYSLSGLISLSIAGEVVQVYLLNSSEFLKIWSQGVGIRILVETR
ncbi:O-methyltransferase [Hyphodiscus hymeniophilus]|uniref:O-methyltransferase n=1 Tax=Hyphodiscus hymeniophilus TaxID=353542 RepID=A0A9P6VNE0_9HELO|nr:O-methyltransferase [Hyphodiscus hymeniophilus]